MNHIDAMKLALEALEKYCTPYQDGTHPADEAITALREAIAEQPAQGCDHCNHSLYAGTKCKNCGRVTEQAAIKRDLTPEQPAQEPKRWAVFCGSCRKEWSVSYPHPGKSICTDCDDKLAERKPFAWADTDDVCADTAFRWVEIGDHKTPVYTSPPAQRTWVGLTDDEFGEIYYRFDGMELMRAIEAKLKEKNT